eukprot:SAG31_NODE_3_length_45830_cov_42.279701_2_plen_495_part_00
MEFMSPAVRASVPGASADEDQRVPTITFERDRPPRPRREMIWFVAVTVALVVVAAGLLFVGCTLLNEDPAPSLPQAAVELGKNKIESADRGQDFGRGDVDRGEGFDVDKGEGFDVDRGEGFDVDRGAGFDLPGDRPSDSRQSGASAAAGAQSVGDAELHAYIASTVPRCTTDALAAIHVFCGWTQHNSVLTLDSLSAERVRAFQYGMIPSNPLSARQNARFCRLTIKLVIRHCIDPNFFDRSLHNLFCSNDTKPSWSMDNPLRAVSVIELMRSPGPGCTGSRTTRAQGDRSINVQTHSDSEVDPNDDANCKVERELAGTNTTLTKFWSDLFGQAWRGHSLLSHEPDGEKGAFCPGGKEQSSTDLYCDDVRSGVQMQCAALDGNADVPQQSVARQQKVRLEELRDCQRTAMVSWTTGMSSLAGKKVSSFCGVGVDDRLATESLTVEESETLALTPLLCAGIVPLRLAEEPGKPTSLLAADLMQRILLRGDDSAVL